MAAAPGGGAHTFGASGQGDVLSRIISTLDPDTRYTFRFLATGDGESDWSLAGEFATDLTDASVPVFTSAIARATSIQLDWQDNATTETSYILQRSTDGDGPYTRADVGNVTTYTDSGLEVGTTYYYQLAATNNLYGSTTAFALARTNATTSLPSVERFVAATGSDTLNDGLSWAQPYATIAHALAQDDAHTITVSNGIYTIVAELVIDSPVTIRGYGNGVAGGLANAALTVIDRGGSGSRVVHMTHAGVVLDGLTITGGSVADFGGGIYMTAGTIRDCIIESNKSTGSASYYGGGGIYIPDGGDGTVSNCVIRRNLCNTLYRDGGGAGIYAYAGTIQNCQIVDNTNLIGRAGGIWCNANPIIRNCLIARNKANNNRKGGGIYIRSGNALIESCTVVSNSVVGTGGGIARSTYGVSGTPTVRNCIIYFNTDTDGVLENFPKAATYATYTCSPDATSGAGNITTDPLLAELVGGNYRLTATSPCIDAGDDTGVTWPTDLDGNPRISDEKDATVSDVDMGAYENYTFGTLFIVR